MKHITSHSRVLPLACQASVDFWDVLGVVFVIVFWSGYKRISGLS